MSELLVKALLAYLLGTVLAGPLLARLRGIDLRRSGSGNIGATNALRSGGWRLALPVLLIDIAKGVIAVTLIPALPWPGEAAHSLRDLALVCGAAVSFGHCYPVWTGFRGGKGVATLAGVFAVLLPASFVLMLAGFVLVVLASGYVALGSIVGALIAAAHVLIWDTDPQSGAAPFVLAMAVLVFFTHRENLIRLRRGEESRFEKMALLRRWLKR